MNIRSFAAVALFVAAFLAFMSGFARADDRFPPRDMAVHIHKAKHHHHKARRKAFHKRHAHRRYYRRAITRRDPGATVGARRHVARRHPPHQPVIIPRPWRAVGHTGRPEGCPPRNWCGCFMTKLMGIPDRALWLARNWAKVGVPAGGPRVGAIVVWRHHVGRVTAVDGNRIRVLSGNDGRRVRDRWRSTRGVIAYRLAAR